MTSRIITRKATIFTSSVSAWQLAALLTFAYSGVWLAQRWERGVWVDFFGCDGRTEYGGSI